MSKSHFSTISLYLFYFVATINLLEQVISTGWLGIASKPLLMILLIIYYLSACQQKSTSLSKLMVGALLFSWIGDILLMLQGIKEQFFLYGLSAFLVAHILYIFAYRLAKFEAQDKEHKSFILTRIVFLLFVGIALVYMLYPFLENLLIPVVLYTAVIVTMGMYALLRRGWTLEKSFIMVYSGALLFIMSDAIIAINKFISPIAQSSLLIMATYIAAQFLIVKGILAHEKAQAERNDAIKG